MNKLIIGLLALSALGSAGWAMYERIQKERAIVISEVTEARLMEAENMALLQRVRAEECREESEKQRQLAAAAQARAEQAMADCMNRRR